MTQIARGVSGLRDRLAPRFTDRYELSHTAPTHPGGNFLRGIDDVFTVTVHETDGLVLRSDTRRWYRDYRNAGGHGVGPQLAVWPDGSVVSLVELPYITGHASFVNGKSIGVETGHGNDGRFGDEDIAPDLRPGQAVRHSWHEISGDAEDVPTSTSAKYYGQHNVITGDPNFRSEVVVAPWTTADYESPARSRPGDQVNGQYNTLVAHSGHPPPVPTTMLFTEEQYRAWALLARYLSEAFLIPRNFPVLPHARRDHMTVDIFKKIVLADQRFTEIVAGLNTGRGTFAGVPLAFVEADFTDPAQAASLNRHFNDAAVAENAGVLAYANVAFNAAWLRLFDFYRGFHGHGFSGNIQLGLDDHDCPGPMFDWHRFAREVWDWWWYPFDFDAGHTTTAVPEREYRRAVGDTPLVEYFFDESPDQYTARTSAPGGIHGPVSSPHTFRLEEGARVYAPANGELIAARFPSTGDVSMAFALIRHEVWHDLDPGGLARAEGLPGPDPAHGGPAEVGRIDYDAPPATVYSLHMHLGRPAGMSFEQVSDHNPDWLNRALIRRKECDLAVPAGHGLNLAPALAQWPVADFTAPPGDGFQGLINDWYVDRPVYARFLADLAAGRVAIAPRRDPVRDLSAPTPVRIILGDVLGVAGVVRRVGGASTFGVRVEVFSTANIDQTYFTSITDQTGWSVPAGVAHAALKYQSEWARTPGDADVRALTAIGVDPQLVPWWSEVQAAQAFDARIPNEARLPSSAQVFHYAPIDFMRWINDITWTSEWPKYRLAGPKPAPRSRRV